MSTPTTSAHTDAGVKRRRNTQDTHEEKAREHNRFPWKARRENKWGSPNTPSDVVNMGTHVFECEWAKRDSDLNRFLAMCSCFPQWFDDLSDVIPSLCGWRQRVEVLLHNKVQAEEQEQELANELSKELEVHTGTMKVPSEKAWALALNKRQLLAENDFGKLLNGVVADGQTLHIVFLLSYGAESVRVLLDITNGSCVMRVDETTALNEEEIMFWLTLKRSNTTSILTAVMVPHVVAAWLDIEERDAT